MRISRLFTLALSVILLTRPCGLSAQTFTTDVAVIGAGAAGLSAALEARLLGADVIVLEKEAEVGGNTILAAGGLSVPNSPVAQASHLAQGHNLASDDSSEIAYADMLRIGMDRNNPELARYLIEEAPAAYEWLLALGADLRETARGADASKHRLHRPAHGRFQGLIGPEIIRTLYREAYERKVDLRTDSTVLAINRNAKGRATTLKVKDAQGTHLVTARAVVIATGGFSSSVKLVQREAPRLSKLASTNHPGATGDGIRLAERLGAATVDLRSIEIEPTLLKKSRRIAPEKLRRKGAVLLNSRGERFVNELGNDLTVATAMRRQKDHRSFLFFNQTVMKTLKNEVPVLLQNDLLKADSLDELAHLTGMSERHLEKTLTDWQKAKIKGEDRFGRNSFPWPLSGGPYYVAEVLPARHYTPGGLKIDKSARVLNASDRPIAGLFAAGEVTGGIHGSQHLIGNALTDAVVFGRTAGRQAAIEAIQMRMRTKETLPKMPLNPR